MARTCTWDGGGATANASEDANWDLDTKPVAGDSIVFPTTTKSCTWDLNLSLVTFTVNAGYVQTITQASGSNMTFSGNATISGACTINLHSTATFSCAAYSQTTGTVNLAGGSFTSTTFTLNTGSPVFAGSSSAISTTAVTFGNSASLTATSGTWTLAGSWTQSGSSTTFTHNSGTINITAASTFNDARSTFNKCNISGGNIPVTISASTTFPLGATPTISTGTSTLTVSGILTWSGLLTVTAGSFTTSAGTLTGTSTPAISVNGNVNIGATSTITNAIDTITLVSTTSSTVTDTGNKLSGTTFVLGDGSNKNVTIAASTNCRTGASPNINLGTGTLTVTGTWTFSANATITGACTATGTITGTSTPTISISRSLTTSGATITNPIGTVTFTLAQATSTYTDTTAALTASTFVINGGAATGAFTVAASTTLALGANPTMVMTSGAFTVNGTVTWTGTCTSQSTANWSIASGAVVTASSTPLLTLAGGINFNSGATLTNAIPTITLNGTGSATITDTGDKLSASTYVFNKGSAGGTVTVAASTNCRVGASPTTTVASGVNFSILGTLSGTGTWTHDGNISVGAGGTVSGFSSQSVNGNLNVNATGTYPTIPIAFTGTLASTLTGTTATFGTVTVNKSGSNSFAVASNTVCPVGANPTITTGTGGCTCTGTLSGSGALTLLGGGDFNAQGGTLTGFTSVSNTDGGIGFNSSTVIPAGLNVTVNFTNSTNRNFTTGDLSYGAFTRIGNGSNTLTLTGSGTFMSFTDNEASIAHTIKFTAGTTQTITGSLLLAGRSLASPLTLSSVTSGSTWSLSPSADFTVTNVVVSDSTIVTYYGYAGSGSTIGPNTVHWQYVQSTSKSGQATIQSGNTVSNAVDLGTVNAWDAFVGFSMPSSFTGTALTFQVSTDGSNFQDLYDSSNAQVSITVSVSKDYGFTDDVMSVLSVWRYVKLVSNAAEGSDRTIPLYIGPSRIVRAPVEAF